MTKILIVDDNPDILAALELLLSLHEYEVITANTYKDALFAVERLQISLVIQDMNFSQGLTSGNEGKTLFYQLRQVKPDLPIILITAWTQLETAIELVKQGAVDYLPKPWNDGKLLELISAHVGSTLQKPEPVTLVAESAAMKNLCQLAEKVADSDVNVLITGPNGSGKEKIADHIHQHSKRKAMPFVKVNMGALPAQLMEAELFGAEKGAFTGANQKRIGRFEAADGGTLFLDEIGNLPLSGQMKLLRVLQTGEFERLGSNETIKVNVRVVSATNENLQLAVQQGSFREDLFYRLNVVNLDLLPLKQRIDDIIPLAKHFIGSEYLLSSQATASLLAHQWPGNVRELENACKRALVFAESNELQAIDFNLSEAQPINRDEKSIIVETLKKHNGVIKHAAQELGLSRQALYRRIEKYQISE
ncbi:sigma-54-dependent transcriptional regulator [Thalassotalea marina]|uniref:Sigma-54-dependent Fis family transcriptional regulator n=1 Tax=Thalassotalea marina TaxID=1673741 RepID=A0A919EJV6_9GAMM|nr:sigma-54 dependent transcriptional regulator [Thalassotalea marina]GHF92690.1 sigma-54-dependent Fis family transcriptional regulator [Thalassotalea marina]